MNAPLITARDFADRLGLKRYARSWRGNCPACDYKLSFAVREGRDHRPMLFCANGCSRDDLDRALQAVFAGSWGPPERPDAENEAEARERKQAAALRIWNGSDPVRGTPAELYLRTRHIEHVIGSAALRYRRDVPHPEAGRNPAMIALVQGVDDRVLGVHRSYITASGNKANIEPAKASLGPIWGGAVRIDPIAPELVIGEGIETSASAGKLLGLPAWAAISGGNLARGLVLPPEVRSIIIAADSDPAGERAARDGALRWSREGRKVRIARPDRENCDFNDILAEHADG